MRGHRDLLAVLVAAAACAAAALLVPVGWLSLLLLAPLAFFLTGYAIAAASFVAAPQPWPRALWISVGLSLAVLALLPLPLNYLGGLRAGTWALALVLVVLVACAVAARRRPADWSPLAFRRPPRPPALALLVGLGALALVAAAVVLAHTTLSNSKALGFTELWMKPAAGGDRVRVGVGNEEQHWTTFVVQARFAGGTVEKHILSLYPGAKTTFDFVVLPRPRPGRPTFVSIVLSRQAEESDHPYRRVYGWIPAGAE
ncbi:MAG: hypothetical protein JSU06_14070 [Actinobacteria bacterium]|nr:hypothetical protein [Actinomycetota bacterium]